MVGSLPPGAASWNRPVSIGLTTTRSRSRSIRGTCRAGGSLDTLADEAVELGRGAPDGERTGRLADSIGRPREGGIEGLGDDGEVGKFGHGGAIVAA